MENQLKDFNQQNQPLYYPKAVIFDWDNTLVESHPTITTAINLLYRDFDMPTVSVEHVRTSPQRALKDSFPEMFGERWEEARDIYHKYYREIHLEQLTPHPGAHEVLDHLSSLELPLFIVSNKSHGHLEAEIKALDWHNHFHFIRGSLDGRVDKPDPEAVHHALEDTGIHPDKDVWFVGDSPIDVQCALNSGCFPVVVKEDKSSLNFKYFEEPVVFIDNLLDIKDLLAKSK